MRPLPALSLGLELEHGERRWETTVSGPQTHSFTAVLPVLRLYMLDDGQFDPHFLLGFGAAYQSSSTHAYFTTGLGSDVFVTRSFRMGITGALVTMIGGGGSGNVDTYVDPSPQPPVPPPVFGARLRLDFTFGIP